MSEFKEFENWFLSTPTGKALSAANLGYYIFERHFDEYRDRDVEMAYRAYAYQQAKVEELEKEWLEMNQQHERAVKECFEVNAENKKLQKRVDKALQVFEKGRNGCFDIHDLFVEIEQALKGEG